MASICCTDARQGLLRKTGRGASERVPAALPEGQHPAGYFLADWTRRPPRRGLSRVRGGPGRPPTPPPPRPPAALLLRLGALSSPAGEGGLALRWRQPHRPPGSVLRTFRSHQAAASSPPVRKVHHALRIGSGRVVRTCAKWGNRGAPPRAPSRARGGGQRLRVWSPDAPRCVRNRAPPSHQ